VCAAEQHYIRYRRESTRPAVFFELMQKNHNKVEKKKFLQNDYLVPGEY
jgi:hypothetical protein